MNRLLNPVEDPQQEGVYRAQSVVANHFTDADIEDLAAATAYVEQIARIEGIAAPIVRRAHWYDGSSGWGLIVNWAGKDSQAPTDQFSLPSGELVQLYDPKDRFSGFDIEKSAILIARNRPPLSHRLLLLHELAHVAKPIEPAQHAPAWVRTWLDIVARRLPSELDPLRIALAERGVESA